MDVRRPGRPVKWKQGITPKYFKMPNDLVQKLRQDIEAGKFSSEVEAIYFYVMNAGKLDDLAQEIAKLKRELELKEAENQALRKKVEVLGREKAEALREAEEWKRKFEELELKLKESFVSVAGEKEKEVESMTGGRLIEELEKIDLIELAREYYKLREALHRQDGYFVFLGEDRLKRTDVEARIKELRERINQILDLRGISRLQAWKLINRGKFDDFKKLLGG